MRGRVLGLLLACVCSLGPGSAQQGQPVAGLPNAPEALASQQTSQATRQAAQQPSQQAAPEPDPQGSISGTVLDPDGDALAGAEVHLNGASLLSERKATADIEGYFSFTGLPPGDYSLSLSAIGFEPEIKPLRLGQNEQMETPDVTLRVGASDMVNVTLSQHDVAEEQIHAEEHQRIAGVIPNFYVTYDWRAAPLSAGQKYKLAWRASIDPADFIISGIIAGVEQATNAFPGYGQGAAGFGKRYGASLADGTVGTFLGGAVFPALLHQDPRYFYKGTGSVWSRALYALATAVICRGDNGKWQLNYSSVLADVASGAVSNLYYPASDRNGATTTVEIGLLNAAEDGFSNLLQEFVFNRVSTGVHKKSTATPPPAPSPAQP
jgi:hypothetical protein